MIYYSQLTRVSNVRVQVTWLVLNKRNVPGDSTAVAYIFVYASLYLTLRLSTTLAENALGLSIGLAAAYTVSALLATVTYRLSPWHPLAKFPGPLLWRVSSLWLTYISFNGRRHLILHRLHAQYGAFLRIGEY